MNPRRLEPIVHAAWTASWFDGDPSLAALFGAPPTEPNLRARAAGLSANPEGLRCVTWDGSAPGPESLVVVAGQQPVLLGGPGLVVHKCASAIALAASQTRALGREVRPVFLLATQDHDSSEIDHLDLIRDSSGSLHRVRAKIRPRSEMFARSRWDERTFGEAESQIDTSCVPDGVLSTGSAVADHVRALLLDLFAGTGLGVVLAHELPGEPTGRILARALDDPRGARASLEHGAAALERAGLRVPFDPADRRPLVLCSRDGRRRRLTEHELDEARTDLAAQLDDYSPHAAVRPLVQAAALPVLAQVVGPSELLYLGQARTLHEWAGVPAPLLVPRMEATRVQPDELDRAAELLGRVTAADGLADPELGRLAAEAAQATQALTAAVRQRAPGLSARARRFDRRIQRDLERWVRAPEHHRLGRDGLLERVRPRGRSQDAVLAWLPDALAAPDRHGWAEQLIQLAEPTKAPNHILYAAQALETDHG